MQQTLESSLKKLEIRWKTWNCPEDQGARRMKNADGYLNRLGT